MAVKERLDKTKCVETVWGKLIPETECYDFGVRHIAAFSSNIFQIMRILEPDFDIVVVVVYIVVVAVVCIVVEVDFDFFVVVDFDIFWADFEFFFGVGFGIAELYYHYFDI